MAAQLIDLRLPGFIAHQLAARRTRSRVLQRAFDLAREFIGLAATVVMVMSFAIACAEAPGKSSDVYLGSRPTTLAAGEPEPPRVYLDTTRNAGADGKNIGCNLNKTHR